MTRAFAVIAAGCAVCCSAAGRPTSRRRRRPTVAATAAEHEHDAPTPTPAAEAAPAVPVLEQELAYGEGQRNNLVGYLAMPQDAAEPLPGIIVIHEWWGLNDNIKAMTRRLAGEGYVVLAVDLYGGATAETPEAAQALMAALLAEPDAALRNLGQAYDYLEKYAFAPRIASIGWCLGGGWSLQTALLYPDALDAMVMYYGQVVTDRDRLAPLNVPVLGFFGAEDESIPGPRGATVSLDVDRARQECGSADRAASRSCVRQSERRQLQRAGANEAWATTLAFLERHLKLSTPTRAQ